MTFLINTAFCLLGVGLVYFLVYFEAPFFVRFQAEDNWAEYASFTGWGLAAVLFVLAAFRGGPGWRRLGPVLFGFACFLVAMEEISWGERILNLSAPEFFQDENLQSELTLHNLAWPGDYIPHVVRVTIFFAFLWPVASRWISGLQKLRRRFAIPAVPVELLPFFVVPVFIHYWYLSPIALRIPFGFEIVELTLGIAMAVLASDVLRQIGNDRHAGRRPFATTVAVLAGVWLFAAPLVFFFSDDAAVKRQLHQFTAHYFPGRVMPREALRVHNYFARHPDMRSPETRFHEGILFICLGQRRAAGGRSSSPFESPIRTGRRNRMCSGWRPLLTSI